MKRRGLRWLCVVLLGFLGLTGLAGGIEMLIYPQGNQFVSGAWLNGIPLIDSYLLPGLVLGIGFGLIPLALIWAWLSGQPWVRPATAVLGAGLLVWIGLEVWLIPARSVLEAIYAVIGAALLLFGLTTAVSGAPAHPVSPSS